jgi:mannose-6-phosphate isomerase
MQALEHDERPWGCYDVLLDTDFTKVKLITVAPGQRLSYQYHTNRREQWTVVEGVLTVVLDDEIYTVKTGGSIHIPLEAKHRAWNKTDEVVQFIEVQTGTYFGEDDIIRLEDDYDRAQDDPYFHLADGNYIGGLTMPIENTNKLNKDE